MNLREQIANAQDIKLDKLHVKPWGCDIYLRQWSPREQANYHDWCDQEKKDGKELSQARVNCKLLINCVCDEVGVKVFTDDDFDLLMSKSVTVIDHIASKILKLHAVSIEDLEGKAKNS